jgi:hypothetical protein
MTWQGLAYLLKLLQQNDAFESLYWWDTAQARYAEERRQLQEGAGGAKGSSADANSLALKRIRSYEVRGTAPSKSPHEQCTLERALPPTAG